MIKIEISKRHYNGDYGIGSVFNEKYSFEVDNGICVSKALISFCSNEDFGADVLSNVNISIPYIMNNDKLLRLDNIINEIKNNNYVYNETHYNKNSFDFKKYEYIDLIIDNNSFELSMKENSYIIEELYKVLSVDKLESVLKNSVNQIKDLGGQNNE